MMTPDYRPNGVESIVAWDDMDEAAKRYHLAWSHGYLPAALGGWEPTDSTDDPRGPDAWILDGGGGITELNSMHDEDHSLNDGGGGRRRHYHPGAARVLA